MPSFFNFQNDADNGGPVNETTPLLGRFRAVPNINKSLKKGSYSRRLSADFSFNINHKKGFQNRSTEADLSRHNECYGSDVAVSGRLKRWWKLLKDLCLEPEQTTVSSIVEKWWSRWIVLILLPAIVVSHILSLTKQRRQRLNLDQPVAWCAIPFPKYDLNKNSTSFIQLDHLAFAHKPPGHGAPKVEINFWYFLFVYYALYNFIALIWITKVFNLYGLNWWPGWMGFPVTLSTVIVLSIIAPMTFYYLSELQFLLEHNTTWMCWTFFIMSIPLLIAFTSLLTHERHLSLRNSLTKTQRIFTTSWWNGDTDAISTRDSTRRANSKLHVVTSASSKYLMRQLNTSRLPVLNRNLTLLKRWLPVSFVRFIWFSTALFISMLAYVLGEAYAEIYLRTLPHNTFQTIVYVYTWVVTVHLLDAITGWILGGRDGERVGSYPLGWTFKLYFSLTYQTYVRALYARLRSPSQFLVLQVISSSVHIFLAPLTMWKRFHFALKYFAINDQTLQEYQKFCVRNIFIRVISECVSMLAFLGSILVLHYGANKDVYPYFAFEPSINSSHLSTVSSISSPPSGDGKLPVIGDEYGYDFGLTFYASIVTFACEIVAGWVVRRILWYGWHINVTDQAILDLKTWPELVPTTVVVMVHVLQNMLFSIVRLCFH